MDEKESRHTRGDSVGRVSLIGAGPGDPELLTLKAKRRLEEADVVFFDNRVNRSVLAHCPEDVRCVYVGKVPGGRRTSQNVINGLLAKEALQGLRVVRLKGGDPFVFGRGGEEAIHLREQGIHVEVVPGISSCLAAPALAGIPVTHRGLTTHFSVITGMSAIEDRDALAESWRALARSGGTLVVLMGVRRLPEVVDAFVGAGLPAATPAAMVASGGTDDQRVVEGTLDDIVERVRTARIEPPATFVVGEVVHLREGITAESSAGTREQSETRAVERR